MARVLVFGGRNYADRPKLFRILDAAVERLGMNFLIHGAATGADALAAEWALSREIGQHAFPAVWDDIHRPGAAVRYTKAGRPYDAAAGGIRNQRMIDVGRPEIAIGFPGGAGTRDMASRVRSAGIPLYEIQ